MGTAECLCSQKLRGHCVLCLKGGFGLVLYLLMIGGLLLAVINVTARVADSAFTGLTIEGSATPKSLRVKHRLEPDAPAMALAKGLDRLPANASAGPIRPSVAGWTKRGGAKSATSLESPAALSNGACGARCERNSSPTTRVKHIPDPNADVALRAPRRSPKRKIFCTGEIYWRHSSGLSIRGLPQLRTPPCDISLKLRARTPRLHPPQLRCSFLK